MNYIDELAIKIYAKVEGEPLPDTTSMDFDLYRNYALLALSSGILTTARNVHDAWSAWCARLAPEHHSLIPFERLSDEIQELDEPYRDAIISVARSELAFRQSDGVG